MSDGPHEVVVMNEYINGGFYLSSALFTGAILFLVTWNPVIAVVGGLFWPFVWIGGLIYILS